VPAESERLRRRISARDRWFLVLLVVAAIVATPLAVMLASHDSGATADDGCVTTMRASIMGGATYKYCGPDAAVACRRYSGDDHSLAARCQYLGLPTRS
jgi:hypothetical protein